MDAKDAQWAYRHLDRLKEILFGERFSKVLGGRQRKDGVKWWLNAIGDAQREIAVRFAGDKVFLRDHRMMDYKIPFYEWLDDMIYAAETCVNLNYSKDDDKAREKLKVLRDRLNEILEKAYFDEKISRKMDRDWQLGLRPNEEPKYSEEECEKVRR